MRRRNSIIILFCVAAVMFFGCAKGQMYVSSDVQKEAQPMESAGEESGKDVPDGHSEGQADIAEGQIYVYVCGYVNHPGVYPLKSDARICDALAMAGGVTPDGAGEMLNQAEHVTDGQTVYVPGMQDGQTRSVDSTEDTLLNLNTVGREELMTLPGIGESKADTIIEYRKEHGYFNSIEDLMNIPGIKEGIFDKIKPYIKV